MLDFLAEFIVELVGELAMDIGVDAACDQRRPRWIRVLILTVVALFFAAVIGILLATGIMAFRKAPVVSFILFAMAVGFVALGLFKLRKILKTFARTKTG